jgi:hypothetical protein
MGDPIQDICHMEIVYVWAFVEGWKSALMIVKQ